MKYVVDFGAWAYEKYRRFSNAQALDPSLACVVSQSSRTTVIVNMKNGKTSFSKCHKCDTFHAYIGLGVAWARYIGEEIPKQVTIVKISELTPGQKFAFSNEAKEKEEFYYIGHNPVNNFSIAVHANSGECYQVGMNHRVIKI